MVRQMASALALAVAVGACAGRSPDPVAVVQRDGDRLSCASIVAQVAKNDAKIKELGREEGGKVAQNVVYGVAGFFIPLLWVGMDFQNAAAEDVVAVQQRQSYLAKMAEQRACGTAQPKEPANAIDPLPAGVGWR